MPWELAAAATCREVSGDTVLMSTTTLPAGAPASAPLGPGIFGVGQHGVRVLAAGPEFTSRCPDDRVKELVADAREVHGLTVVDCGTLAREADQVVLLDFADERSVVSSRFITSSIVLLRAHLSLYGGAELGADLRTLPDTAARGKVADVI